MLSKLLNNNNKYINIIIFYNMDSSLYYPELCHFGQACGSGIIINDILKIKKKELFMLGIYPLNSIIPYLKSKNYEDIYKIEYLKHDVSQPWLVHTLYDFGFPHDYKIKENKIINYDEVKQRFDEKIKNFKDTLNNNDLTIFITVQLPSTDVIINAINWLEENKPNFHLVLMDIDRKRVDPSIISEKVSLIRLEKADQPYWNNMFSLKSKDFFEEMYVKFLDALHQKNIKHNYPKFEDTQYRLDFESINKFWPSN